MHNTLFITCAIAALLTAAATADQPAKPAQQATERSVAAATGSAAQPRAEAAQPRPEDEKAIRLLAEAFVQAYNAGDAKALAALFVADGEIVSQTGETHQSQKAIEDVFNRIFKTQPKAQIKVTIDSIRFLGPNVAMEDGNSAVTDPTGQPLENSHYSVVHIKQDGKWRMASARDLPDEAASAAAELRQLEWMVGEWMDESSGILVTTSYRWDKSHCYILGEFHIQIGDRAAVSGSQRIGWDPLTKAIRSWVYDSEGGFAEGIWTRNGNRWIVKLTGVTHDGKPSSSTNITTHVAKNRMTWQSRDRILGGKTMPDSEEIPIVQKPPKPKLSANNASRDVAGESK